MNKLKKTSMTLATATGVLLITLTPASAFEGEGRMGMRGMGPGSMAPENRAQRDEKRAELEAFVGLSRDEIRTARRSGQSMGDILAAQGKSEADAETFLTEQANQRVEMIAEDHALSAEEKFTLQERVSNFVQSMLSRWFNK